MVDGRRREAEKKALIGGHHYFEFHYSLIDIRNSWVFLNIELRTPINECRSSGGAGDLAWDTAPIGSEWKD